jgi:hypothetical protein
MAKSTHNAFYRGDRTVDIEDISSNMVEALKRVIDKEVDWNNLSAIEREELSDFRALLRE